MAEHRIGVIGGSGLYNIDGFDGQHWVSVETPFGPPSDELLMGRLGGREVVFLPRHARGHRLTPSELNHRANIWAMRHLGVRWILSVGAVGSLREDYKPCDIVMVDQFFDRTKRNADHSFFGNGIVAHIGFAHPICEGLRALALESARDVGARVHDGGVYVNMEGPAFSTRAESEFHRRMGFDVVGMTNLGEAKLAREAEISYASLAMITDYDCWHEDEASVSVELVIENLHRNAETAKRIVKDVVPKIPEAPNWESHEALASAILTAKAEWPPETLKALRPILANYT